MMNILCSTDNAYVPATGVMLTSLLMHNSDVNIYILSNGELTSESTTSLSKLSTDFGCCIHFVPVDAAEIGKVPDKPWPIETYLRLISARHLPADMHKVLYLDGDIIVDGSLEELWNTDIVGYSAAVVPEYQNWVSRENISSFLQDGHYDYFNSGVMLINLDYWREHDLAAVFLKTIPEIFDKICYVDQDVMNHVLKDKVKFLPIRYNFQICYAFSEFWDLYCTEIQRQILEKPVIMHFTVLKPWIMTSFGIPFRDTWVRYMKASRWRIKEKLPDSKILKRLILRYIIYPLGIKIRYGIIDKYAYNFPTYDA